jgi:hypothetical protein
MHIRKDIIDSLSLIKRVDPMILLCAILDAISIGDDSVIYDIFMDDETVNGGDGITDVEFYQVALAYGSVRLHIYPYLKEFYNDNYFIEDIIELNNEFFIMLLDETGT